MNEEFLNGGLKYKIKYTKSVEVVGLNSINQTSIIIPSFINIDGFNYPIESIGNDAFSKCSNIISIQIPKSVLSIGNYALFECDNLKSIVIPNSVTQIGHNTFNGCSSLETIQFSDNIKSLFGWTFSRCVNLKNLVLPSKLTYLGSQIFSSCNSLSTITFKSFNPPERAKNLPPFDVYKSIPIYVPKGAAKYYKSDPYWGTFDNYFEKEYFELGVELGKEVKTERIDGKLIITGIPIGVEISIKLLQSNLHIEMGVTKKNTYEMSLFKQDYVLIIDGKLRYILSK